MINTSQLCWQSMLPADAYCLYNEQQTITLLDNWADEIYHAVQDKNPIILCVLTGGVIVTSSLVQRLPCALEIDYLQVSRYRGAKNPRELRWQKNTELAIENRTVVLVDDVLDGGVTMQCIIDVLKQQQPRQILTAVFVDKKLGRVAGGLAQADFTAVSVENEFLIGMGMDLANQFRHVPGLWALPPTSSSD